MNGTATMEVADTEVLAPEIKQKVERELEPYKQRKVFERTAITNAAEAMAATVVVAQRKRDYKELDEIRDRLVRPYSTIVKQINAAFRVDMDEADTDWRTRDQALSLWRTAEQARVDAENRKAIADAEEARRAKEAKEEAARQEAKRLRDEQERLEQEENNRILQVEMERQAAEQKIKDEEAALIRAKAEGDQRAAREAQETIERARLHEQERLRKAEDDRLAAVAEQAKLEKAAIKQDAKADIAASEATMIAPTIQVNESLGSRTLDTGASVGTRKKKRWVFKNGQSVDTKFCRDDPRFKDIGDECFEFNPTIMNKLVNAGVKPAGVTVYEDTMTTVRK